MASNTRGDFFRYWLPAFAYVALIFTLSSIPRLRSPLHFQSSDKLIHVIEYCILGVMLVRALRTVPRLGGALAAGLLTLAIGSAVGAADEYYQRGVPGRESSVSDWGADTLGLAIGQIAYFLITRRRDGSAGDAGPVAGAG